MKQLITDLLQYSRVGTRGNPFKPADLNKVLENVKFNLKASIRETRTKIIAGKFPHIVADKMQMEQLFQNLLSNSIKFRSEKTPVINIDISETTDEWIIKFKDNGIGIEKEYFNKIFVIFQRLHTKDKYEGTGIGLAVCKKIVSRHGGNLEVRSELGKGTEFIITISKNLKNEEDYGKNS
jgi:hypothetical protein